MTYDELSRQHEQKMNAVYAESERSYQARVRQDYLNYERIQREIEE